MKAVRVEATIERDGELHLSDLPCRKGDRVEAIVLIQEEADRLRLDARRDLLEHARRFGFRSERPYPSREELYDRP